MAEKKKSVAKMVKDAIIRKPKAEQKIEKQEPVQPKRVIVDPVTRPADIKAQKDIQGRADARGDRLAKAAAARS